MPASMPFLKFLLIAGTESIMCGRTSLMVPGTLRSISIGDLPKGTVAMEAPTCIIM